MDRIKVKLLGQFALEIPAEAPLRQDRAKFNRACEIRDKDAVSQQLLALLILAHRYLQKESAVVEDARIRRDWLTQCLYGEDNTKTREALRHRLNKLDQAFSIWRKDGGRDFVGIEVDFSELDIDVLQDDFGKRLLQNWSYPWLTEDISIRRLRQKQDERFLNTLYTEAVEAMHGMQLAKQHNDSDKAAASRRQLTKAIERAAERILQDKPTLLPWRSHFEELFRTLDSPAAPSSPITRLMEGSIQEERETAGSLVPLPLTEGYAVIEQGVSEMSDAPQKEQPPITQEQIVACLGGLTSGELHMLIASIKASREVSEQSNFNNRVAELVIWADRTGQLLALYEMARRMFSSFRAKSDSFLAPLS